MSSEICEFDGLIRTTIVEPVKRFQIQELAREFGYHIDVYSEHIELSYQGRNYNNVFVEFLKRLAEVIQFSSGEIKCMRESLAGKEDIHEIYTIDDSILYVQEVILLKGEKKQVD